MPGRRTRPDGSLDDWFAESGQARPRGGEPFDPTEPAGELPYVHDEDWDADESPRGDRQAEGGLFQTLSEWRVVAGAVALVVVLIVGLAVGGVFDSGHRAATTPVTTKQHTSTTRHTKTATTRTTGKTTPATPVPTTTLAPGDRGPDVTVLQQALTVLGYSAGTADGVYGTATKTAVEQFQTASQLTADGLFGSATLAALTTAAKTATTTTPGTTTSATPVPTTTLAPGDHGPDVTVLQQALTVLGYSAGTADGVYGTATKTAVEQFQTASQLTADGLFGSATLAALTTAAKTATTTTRGTSTSTTPAPTTTLAPGDRGSEVTALQQALTALGYSSGTADGVYGTATKTAVQQFQTASHLTADGVFGSTTLAALAGALSGP